MEHSARLVMKLGACMCDKIINWGSVRQRLILKKSCDEAVSDIKLDSTSNLNYRRTVETRVVNIMWSTISMTMTSSKGQHAWKSRLRKKAGLSLLEQWPLRIGYVEIIWCCWTSRRLLRKCIGTPDLDPILRSLISSSTWR